MEANFSSQQIAQVGATGRRTTIVLPSAARKQQKIAVGDHTGVVSCFTAKKGVFEVPPLSFLCSIDVLFSSHWLFFVFSPSFNRRLENVR
jgi:hypothetical protein